MFELALLPIIISSVLCQKQVTRRPSNYKPKDSDFVTLKPSVSDMANCRQPGFENVHAYSSNSTYINERRRNKTKKILGLGLKYLCQFEKYAGGIRDLIKESRGFNISLEELQKEAKAQKQHLEKRIELFAQHKFFVDCSVFGSKRFYESLPIKQGYIGCARSDKESVTIEEAIADMEYKRITLLWGEMTNLGDEVEELKNNSNKTQEYHRELARWEEMYINVRNWQYHVSELTKINDTEPEKDYFLVCCF